MPNKVHAPILSPESAARANDAIRAQEASRTASDACRLHPVAGASLYARSNRAARIRIAAELAAHGASTVKVAAAMGISPERAAEIAAIEIVPAYEWIVAPDGELEYVEI